MSIFDLIFGSSQKIYASQIEKIPATIFNREVRLTVDGEKSVYRDLKLKQLLIDLACGGISLTRLEEKLKEMGARDDQINRRKEILDILQGTFKK